MSITLSITQQTHSSFSVPRRPDRRFGHLLPSVFSPPARVILARPGEIPIAYRPGNFTMTHGKSLRPMPLGTASQPSGGRRCERPAVPRAMTAASASSTSRSCLSTADLVRRTAIAWPSQAARTHKTNLSSSLRAGAPSRTLRSFGMRSGSRGLRSTSLIFPVPHGAMVAMDNIRYLRSRGHHIVAGVLGFALATSC